MLGLLKALGIAKSAIAIGALTATTTFAATQVVLPAASATGQGHATAGAANATVQTGPAAAPDVSTGKDVQALVERLAANKARLVANLESVLTALEANPNVNEHAKAAIQSVLDRLETGDTGLNRATQAVQGTNPNAPAGTGQTAPNPPSQAQGTLPSQAQGHPTATDHPGKP